MISLTWNICRLLRISDVRLYSMIRFVLQRSLVSLQLQKDYLEERNIDKNIIMQTGVNKGKILFCAKCRRELFVFIWVKRKENEEDERRRKSYCEVIACNQ